MRLAWKHLAFLQPRGTLSFLLPKLSLQLPGPVPVMAYPALCLWVCLRVAQTCVCQLGTGTCLAKMLQPRGLSGQSTLLLHLKQGLEVSGARGQDMQRLWHCLQAQSCAASQPSTPVGRMHHLLQNLSLKKSVTFVSGT